MPPRTRKTPPERPSILRAVQDTRAVLKTAQEDAAALALAEDYARAIDDADDRAKALADLGPKLLVALSALGATPQARAAVLKGGASGGSSRLEALRARRQA